MLEKSCENCGHNFKTNQPKAKFCSEKCRNENWRKQSQQQPLGNTLNQPVETIKEPAATMTTITTGNDFYVLDLREKVKELNAELKLTQKELREAIEKRDSLQVIVNTAEKEKELAIKQIMAEQNVLKGNTLSGLTESIGGKEGVVEIIGMVKELIRKDAPQPTIQLPAKHLNLEGVNDGITAFFKGVLPFLKHMSDENMVRFKDIVEAITMDEKYMQDLHTAIFKQTEKTEE